MPDKVFSDISLAVLDRDDVVIGRINGEWWFAFAEALARGYDREDAAQRASIALQSHQGHRVISGHSGVVTRVAQRPEPLRTASITTMPSLPAHQQLCTVDSAKKRGKAA